MNRLFLSLLLISTLVLAGCSSPNLRVEDFRFGNKRVGRQTEKPVFKAGEEAQLSFAIRGFAPDSAGNGKASCHTTISPELLSTSAAANLPKVENQAFKINSDITSLEIREASFMIPIDAKGDYRLILTIEDEVAEKEIVFEAPFQVEAAAEQTAPTVVGKLEDERAAGRAKICSSNLRNIQLGIEMYVNDHSRLPAELQTLLPDYLVTIPSCIAASADTYSSSYKPGPDRTYVLFCKGHHHAQAGLSPDHPVLRNGKVVFH